MLIRYSSTATKVPNFKRLLPSLIKQVHPDLFANYPESIQQKNLKCAQTLNNLLNTFDNIYTSAFGRDKVSIYIKSPLSPVYDINCSIKSLNALSDSSELSSLIDISYTIKSPNILTTKTMINRKQADIAFKNIFKDLGRIFELFNSSTYWTNFLETEKLSAKFKKMDDENYNISEDFPNISGLQKDIQEKLHKRITFLYINRIRKSQVPISGRDLTLSVEVNTFFRRGNVLVKDLPIVEEIRVMKALKSTMIDYGGLINFRLSSWWRVIIIVSSETSYKVEKIENRFTVSIPCKFKQTYLLNFFRDNLPMADLLYEEEAIDL